MAQLQRPELAYVGGRLVSWEQATLHVGSEAVTRGLSVFEGLKAYWSSDGTMRVAMPRQHYIRLQRSAKLLHIPFSLSYDDYLRSVDMLIGALAKPDRDMWARTTLFGVEGHWGENTIADLIVTGYHQGKTPADPLTVGVSTWRRSADVALPPRIKTGSNYEVSRLARIEGRPQGYEDMVLLNGSGRVAEATASCILMVRNGAIITPPATEGALESITVDLVEAIAQSMGVPFIRRPIDRTELLIADELAICGTLHEITPIKNFSGTAMPVPGPVMGKIRNRYFDAMRGVQPHPAVEMVALPSVKKAA
ncbi:MAG: aminotransferase class IV [Nitrospiraceae bacterium]